MIQEGKALVLKDISARLYYGVKISVPVVEKDMIFTVVGISESWLLVKNDRGSIFNVNTALEFKPYYRPMSSMTKEEKNEYYKTFKAEPYGSGIGFIYVESAESFDWLDKKMFDYRGFIPNGLAIEAPEGMYNI